MPSTQTVRITIPARPAHRARYDLAAKARDVALAAIGRHPRGTAPRHRAPDSLDVRLERDLKRHGYSVTELTAALDAGGAR